VQEQGSGPPFQPAAGSERSDGHQAEDIRPDPQGAFAASPREPLGVETIIHLKAGEQPLLSLVPGMVSLRVGDQLRFSIVEEKLHFFGPDHKRIAEERI
jgi:ABC-type sugar transport system ATPase subunit